MIHDDGTRACSCGAVHFWAELPVYAIWRFDDGGPSLVLKTCSCGSTIAEELPIPPPTLSSTEVSP